MSFDPTTDFDEVVDRLTPVTVVRPGSSSRWAVQQALRQSIRTREAAESAGRYTASDVVWHLPAAELTETPRLGDLVVDADGQRWTVLDVQLAVSGSRWRCVTRNLAIVHDLDQHVDIEKAVFHKTDSGALEAAWQPWKTGVRARIQASQRKVVAQQGRLGVETQWTIYLGEDLALDHTHRVRGPDGTVYQILAARHAERIDSLAEVEAVAETDPQAGARR